MINWIKSSGPFVILLLLGFFSFIFTVYDIIFKKEWMIIILVFLTILLVLTIVLIILGFGKKFSSKINIEEFEKSLKGGLYHYKCQTCNGIFAIKKSKSNNKKPIRMTCPDCGVTGIIPPIPTFIEEDIPEKKSVKANFRCNNCGEGITIWAEGTDLYQTLNVYSCPFCGNIIPLKRF